MFYHKILKDALIKTGVKGTGVTKGPVKMGPASKRYLVLGELSLEFNNLFHQHFFLLLEFLVGSLQTQISLRELLEFSLKGFNLASEIFNLEKNRSRGK